MTGTTSLCIEQTDLFFKQGSLHRRPVCVAILQRVILNCVDRVIVYINFLFVTFYNQFCRILDERV